MLLGVTAWSGLAGARLVAQSCTASPSTMKPAPDKSARQRDRRPHPAHHGCRALHAELPAGRLGQGELGVQGVLAWAADLALVVHGAVGEGVGVAVALAGDVLPDDPLEVAGQAGRLLG